MNLLDYNITADQVELLVKARVHFRRIGFDVGRPEWDDQQELLRYLHRMRRITLFTRDLGFFRSEFCHPNYCIAVINFPAREAASAIRRFLRHPEFKTKALRCGKVVRLSPRVITWWQVGNDHQQHLIW